MGADILLYTGGARFGIAQSALKIRDYQGGLNVNLIRSKDEFSGCSNFRSPVWLQGVPLGPWRPDFKFHIDIPSVSVGYNMLIYSRE